MTLHEFLDCDHDDQLEAIWLHGQLIDGHTEHYYRFELFQLDSFYVEMKFRGNEFISMAAFDCNSTLLIPYIDKIKILI